MVENDRQAEHLARLDAVEAKERAERTAAMELAKQEVTRRPIFDLLPFGRVQLVDEVNCGAADPGLGATRNMRSSATPFCASHDLTAWARS